MIKDLIKLLVVSIVIGILVGVPFRGSNPIIEAVIKSGLSGMVIGICATMAFMFFFKNAMHRTSLSFFIVFVVIGGGTVIASLVSGISDLFSIAMMCLCAEGAGLVATILIYRQSIMLNRNLKNMQGRFKAP